MGALEPNAQKVPKCSAGELPGYSVEIVIAREISGLGTGEYRWLLSPAMNRYHRVGYARHGGDVAANARQMSVQLGIYETTGPGGPMGIFDKAENEAENLAKR